MNNVNYDVAHFGRNELFMDPVTFQVDGRLIMRTVKHIGVYESAR